MAEPALEGNKEMQELQIQGLEHYSSLSRDGQAIQQTSDEHDELIASVPVLHKTGERLGQALGMDTLASLKAFVDQRQIYLQESGEGFDFVVAGKKANVTRLLNSVKGAMQS